ncbi:unnamed protein product [Trifolium pratense]|uniref:Uncharacterized protein n=1 Tax=Trifolium pratense TaxID=57577 RepID=A0ACB0I6N4_TRIPR|nr:unnamed protein product [Trifolium pratense]
MFMFKSCFRDYEFKFWSIQRLNFEIRVGRGFSRNQDKQVAHSKEVKE